MRFQLQFSEDERGDSPVLRWLREVLTPTQRRAIGVAMSEILQGLRNSNLPTSRPNHLFRTPPARESDCRTANLSSTRAAVQPMWELYPRCERYSTSCLSSVAESHLP
jgi:hypothetical protein